MVTGHVVRVAGGGPVIREGGEIFRGYHLPIFVAVVEEDSPNIACGLEQDGFYRLDGKELMRRGEILQGDEPGWAAADYRNAHGDDK